MGFLLDDKNNLGRYVIPTGINNGVNVYSDFEVYPNGITNSHFSVYADGTIIIGDTTPGSYNNLVINAGISSSFRQLTDNATDYILTNNDYSVEVISNTYNSITLPPALNIGGRTYVISKGSSNPDFVVRASTGDMIDGRAQIGLKRTNDHIQVQSNGINEWYVL